MITAKKLKLEKRGDYYFTRIGSEYHGRPSHIIWINRKLLKEGQEYIEFPLENAKIHKTEKGNLVIKPDENCSVISIFVPSGFRGESDFEIYPENIEYITYKEFSSPRGNLGIGKGALINMPASEKEIVIKWSRTGRTYGEPKSGVTIIKPNGEIENLEEIEDLEQLEELEKEL
jgi:hypothetical protein